MIWLAATSNLLFNVLWIAGLFIHVFPSNSFSQFLLLQSFNLIVPVPVLSNNLTHCLTRTVEATTSVKALPTYPLHYSQVSLLISVFLPCFLSCLRKICPVLLGLVIIHLLLKDPVHSFFSWSTVSSVFLLPNFSSLQLQMSKGLPAPLSPLPIFWIQN